MDLSLVGMVSVTSLPSLTVTSVDGLLAVTTVTMVLAAPRGRNLPVTRTCNLQAGCVVSPKARIVIVKKVDTTGVCIVASNEVSTDMFLSS